MADNWWDPARQRYQQWYMTDPPKPVPSPAPGTLNPPGYQSAPTLWSNVAVPQQPPAPAPAQPPTLPPGSPALQPDTMPEPSQPSKPAPEAEDPWSKMIYDMLKKADEPANAGGDGGPAGTAPAAAMPFLPATGKGGGVDIVKLAMAVATAGMGAGAMGAMGGMGGAANGASGASGAASGASSASSAMGGGGDWMKMAGNMMGGGGGDSVSGAPTPTAPTPQTGPLPYQNRQPKPPPLMFGTDALMPQSLGVLQQQLRKSSLFGAGR